MTITKNIKHPQKTKLATILSILFIADSYASFVRTDIDYQYFRDLAENKGQFHIGATNVPVFNKDGVQIGTMLNGVPMPDLRIVSRKDGVSTLVSSQFINSVRHNTGINSAEFGGVDKNLDSHHFKYTSSSKHFYPHADLYDPDYQLQRLEKLVTEVAPIPMATAGTDSSAYLDRSRFSSFLRVGSGRQWLRNEAGENTLLTPAYNYLTAGVPLVLANAKNSRINAKGKLTDNVYGPMASYAASGDSGSPLLGFDKKENRWVVIGLAESNFGNEGSQNGYILSRPNYLTEVENAYKVEINNTKANGEFTWKAEQKSSSLKTPTGKVEKVDLFDTTQTDKNAALNHGKNVYFNGQKGTLTLENSINQGAGYLRFNTDFSVKTKDGSQTWLGSGLDIAQGKTVNWAVKNPENDRLSKIGAGTLIINGEGKKPRRY